MFLLKLQMLTSVAAQLQPPSRNATLEEAKEGLSLTGLPTTAHQLHLELQDTQSARV